MSSLNLIVGSIDDAEDPLYKLNLNDLYYEYWDEDPDNPEKFIISREPVPIRFIGNDKFRIIQDKGSGKTLLGMHFFSEKVVFGGKVAANLGLVWHNEGKNKDDWLAVVNSFDDFKSLSHCSVLIDDIKDSIQAWNTTAANVLTQVSGGGRKQGRDDYYTAQREKQIPPEIREQATSWIVPIIRVRDNTKRSPDDHMGLPIEMIYLYFNGAKQLKYVSDPIINLTPLFECYSTTARAENIGANKESGARPDQPGYELEAEAFKWLQQQAPGEKWIHLNGKNVFDIMGVHNAIDVVGQDADFRLWMEHKDFTKHVRTAKAKNVKPFLMFRYGASWGLVRINYLLAEKISGKKLTISPTSIRTASCLVR